MYRVMPHDPDPDGTYHSVPGVSADDKAEPFEIVFKVPRLEVHALPFLISLMFGSAYHT